MNSRIARQPIDIPAGVEVKIDAGQVSIKGQKGELVRRLHSLTTVEQVDNALHVKIVKVCRQANAQAGTSRALLNNMVQGVSVGFERKLELVGVGYRAQVQGKLLKLNLGFSHPVEHKIPEGITIETPSQTEILIKGIDKQVVGQIAADIRAYRPPEPYKGKGVRYAGERVVMKETKKK